MVHCRHYWEIAEENAELSNEVNSCTVANGTSTEVNTRALKESYYAILKELDVI